MNVFVNNISSVDKQQESTATLLNDQSKSVIITAASFVNIDLQYLNGVS